MEKYTFILLPLVLACSAMQSRAQWLNNDTVYNTGSLVTDINDQGHNTATGSYSTAGSTGAPSSFGVFNHIGQSGTGANAAFINDGSYNASINGQDYFKGPNGAVGQQEIAGNIMPVFGQLYLQNGANAAFDITNTNGIRITKSISFENGITTTLRSNTANGAIRMDDDATYAATILGDGQHVNGYVTKTGNDIFTFPVGSGTDLRTLTISAPATTNETYSVAWIAGDPTTTTDPSDVITLHPVNTVTAPITSVSPVGQWDWIPVSGSGAGINISVSIPDLSSTGAVAADLRLVGWNGSSWIDLSGSSTASGVTEGATLNGVMQSDITAIGIGTINISAPLAITYTSFIAEVKNCSVEFTWTIGEEGKNGQFNIQRSSDGNDWATIGRTSEPINNTDQQSYRFTDNSPVQGKNLYRIDQSNKDGSQKFSNIISASVYCGAAWQVYPNPAQEYLVISGAPAKSIVQLINALGQPVITEDNDLGGDRKISLKGLAVGSYFIRITVDNETLGQKTVIHLVP